jgi:hypothetical protein
MQRSKKRFEISCNFSRQGYASDVRSRQSFLTMSVQLASDVQYPQQALPCYVAFVFWELGIYTYYGLLGLICGKTMSQSWHTYGSCPEFVKQDSPV